jgi:hypothetical protein
MTPASRRMRHPSCVGTRVQAERAERRRTDRLDTQYKRIIGETCRAWHNHIRLRGRRKQRDRAASGVSA